MAKIFAYNSNTNIIHKSIHVSLDDSIPQKIIDNKLSTSCGLKIGILNCCFKFFHDCPIFENMLVNKYRNRDEKLRKTNLFMLCNGYLDYTVKCKKCFKY